MNVPIADALSRITPQDGPTVGELPRIDIHHITRKLPASPMKLEQIRQETERDPTLSLLKETVFKGWPEKRSQCPTTLHDYWNFREEVTIEDGILLKLDRIIIPTNLRADILNTIHQGHLGQEKCLLRARTAVFWPGISKDIKERCERCEPCQKYQRQNQKEPILQADPPSYPWQRLSSDLFDYKGNQYLLVADQYSKFPIIRRLTSTTSATIINHLKSIMSEHGIPEELITDNGPQYSSREFKEFVTNFGINHTTSSPHYPQSNGFAERMVQTVKNILKKSDEQGDDPYLAILAYRTTPIDHQLKSPAELLNGRKFKTTLPQAQRASLKSNGDNVKGQLYHRQQIQRYHYDRTAGRELEQLRQGDPVRIFDQHSHSWQPGTVVKPAQQPRSYILRNDNTEAVYRRTRTHLRPSYNATTE